MYSCVVGHPTVNIIRQKQLAVTPGHNRHTRQRGYFLTLKLSIASGHNNCSIGITPGKPTYRLSALFICNLCDTTCIYNHYIRRFPGLYPTYSLFGKQSGHSRGLCKIKFAAKCMKQCLSASKYRLINHNCKYTFFTPLHIFALSHFLSISEILDKHWDDVTLIFSLFMSFNMYIYTCFRSL